MLLSIAQSSRASDADAAHAKEARLTGLFRELGSVIVAYSGGVDSTYLACIAHKALGERALCVTAQSPSMAESEFVFASTLAKERGWNFRAVATHEASDPRWLANDANRCYFCKAELFTVLVEVASSENYESVVYGAIPEDSGDFRPGQKAANERRILAPLVEAGLTKPEIRALSHEHGLPSWDKPQAACLASRFPTGSAITTEELRQVDRSEAALAAMGFRGHRVRHHGSLARIELQSADWEMLDDELLRRRIVEALKSQGYKHVTIDLAGYQLAGLNI